MKFVLASDSFKGSLSAVSITQLLREEAEACFPGVETVCAPVADGGEGTVEALLLALGGERRQVEVSGPLGGTVQAVYGVTPGGLAVMEMAQASGLTLCRERDPLRATSRGTGEMLAHALGSGIREILLGIGGSATNDGGMGMLEALGARFLDGEGNTLHGCGASLARVREVDLSGMLPQALEASITVICDVSNPLLGPQGATAVYGPQKGVTPELLPVLESGMAQYARTLSRATGREMNLRPGYGAAGGMGAALGGVLGARLCKGIEAVMDAVGFDSMLEDADLVVTGEGRMDEQSVAYGKVVAGIVQRAERKGVPVCAVAGGMDASAEAFIKAAPWRSAVTTVNGVMSVQEAMEQAETLYRNAARRMFRLLRMGMRLKA